ncbi:hypothetical protein B0H14DRAFT_2650037 [Mycena olivaceomarginata]|nr:hypothetical protein B0H14DRAFT_2650037 [Mycena olivaceomarginata]
MPRVLYVLSPHGGGKQEFTTGSDTDWAVETLPPGIVQKLVSNEATNGYVILLEKDPIKRMVTGSQDGKAGRPLRCMSRFLNEVVKTVDWHRDWDLIWYVE